jgi:hypothetical protein
MSGYRGSRRRPHVDTSPGLSHLTVHTPEQAKDLMDSKWRCEHCDALHAIKKRALNSVMAAQMMALYRYFIRPTLYGNLQFHMNDSSGHWLHGPKYLTYVQLDRDHSKLRYWGLTEWHGGTKEDGNPRNGYIRITDRGKYFCERRFKVYPHILTYNQGRGCVGYVDGELVDIVDAGGTHFNYRKEIG